MATNIDNIIKDSSHGTIEKLQCFMGEKYPLEVYCHGINDLFYIHLKFYNICSHLHPITLSNYHTNYRNTTGTGPQGLMDNDYPVAINIKICKYQKLNRQLTAKR